MTNAFTTNPREKSLTRQQRAKFFLERGGHCEECGIKLRPGSKWERDHIEALENGGTDCDANCRLLCLPCHGSKTKADHKLAAKIRRVATQNIVPEAHRQKSSLAKRDGYKFNWKARRYERVEP